MKALRKLPGEGWRDVIERYATDPRFNSIGVDPQMLIEEYDYRTDETDEDPRDICWDICECSGLLDTIEGFWSDDGDEDSELAA
jgi:hypothetical protein